jgi:SSS family solute:Na+ symporter
LTSLVLAVFAILAAPLVAGAPEGLYQLLQQLNGIFFIPIASIMFAGLFIPYISAKAAKAGLLFGLAFYILTSFVFQVDIHFVHLWGIEFVLNMILMFVVSRFYPNTNTFKPEDIGAVVNGAMETCQTNGDHSGYTYCGHLYMAGKMDLKILLTQ